MYKAYAAILALLVLLSLSVGLSFAASQMPPLPPCETEDATYDCVWDASLGNGMGTDFIQLDGVLYYPQR